MCRRVKWLSVRLREQLSERPQPLTLSGSLQLCVSVARGGRIVLELWSHAHQPAAGLLDACIMERRDIARTSNLLLSFVASALTTHNHVSEGGIGHA